MKTLEECFVAVEVWWFLVIHMWYEILIRMVMIEIDKINKILEINENSRKTMKALENQNSWKATKTHQIPGDNEMWWFLVYLWHGTCTDCLGWWAWKLMWQTEPLKNNKLPKNNENSRKTKKFLEKQRKHFKKRRKLTKIQRNSWKCPDDVGMQYVHM